MVKADATDFNTAWEDNSFANLSGEPADNINLSTALTALQANITAETARAEATEANKVDKATGYGLSSNDYTSTEKTKLANLSNYFVGVFASASALSTAHSVGLDGQYAVVESTGSDAVEYVWDTANNLWVAGGTGSVTSVNSQTGAVSLSTDNIGEGATNLYFTAARAIASVLTGVSFLTGGAVVSTDTVLQAFGKLQAQITALLKIPAGGTTGQLLSKIDDTDGNTQWIDAPSGGGGTWGSITGTLSAQTDLETALNLLAPKASPALTGTPTAPTQAALDNSTNIATTAYADAAVTAQSTKPFFGNAQSTV